MSAFTEPLEITPNPDGKTWTVERDLVYHVGAEDSAETITVPAGFVTDLASVPRALWSIFAPFGRYTQAAVIHDYLYVVGGVVPGGAVYTKDQADRIFEQASKNLGVGQPARWLMYQAVHHFGRGAFK